MARNTKVTTEITSLFSALDVQTKALVKESAKKEVDRLLKSIKTKEKELNEALRVGKKLNVISSNGQHSVNGLKHKSLEKLITLCANRLPVLMVGMAGTGKTHAAEQVAEGLGLNFYAISVGAQTSKSDIMGYMHANGGYVETLFRKAYEHGGVFLVDEIDAGNSNVLVQINAALSNTYCAFPDKMVKKHDDFVFVASANTFGFGANRLYVGRNQLDAATLDRFTVLVWEIDEKLEENLIANNTKWLKVVRACREQVAKEEIRTLVTPRATIRGAKLLESGMEFSEALDLAILNSIPADRQASIRETAESAWR